MPALLVTHDFTEAALLGDAVAVLDARADRAARQRRRAGRRARVGVRGRLHGRGRAHRRARGRAHGGLTHVALDGGGEVRSTDGRGERRRGGQRAIPWEIALEPAGARALAARPRTASTSRVVSVTAVGNRVRVGLAAPQPLVAELSDASAASSSYARRRVVASWKAAATRLVRR